MKQLFKFLSMLLVVVVMMATLTPIGSIAESNEVNGSENSQKYIVKYKDSAKKDKAKKELEKQNKKAKKDLKKSNALSVDISLEELKSTKDAGDIEMIEPDYEIETEAVDAITWGIDAIGAATVHNNNITGQGVKVAVLDTGIAPHDDLNVVGGVSFVDGDSSYIDENGHGTHVAGIIAAQANNIGLLGVAPNVELYAVKVLDKNGRGNYSNIIAGIEWAIDNDVDVINMSFGGNNYSQILEEAMNLAYQNNIILIASAGNAGSAIESTVSYPAKYSSVIAVAAVNDALQRAEFSSVGKEVEVSAPGVAIESTYLNNTYSTLSGTSMAAPHVAGVAALILSREKNATNDEVRSKINNATFKNENQLREHYGRGILNAELAIGVIPTDKSHTNTSNGNNNSNISYPFEVSAQNASKIKIKFEGSFSSADSVELTIGEKDTKNIVFQGEISNNQTISNIEANKEYSLAIKGITGNAIESYNATIKLISNPEKNNAYSVSLTSIYRNIYDASKLIVPNYEDLTEDEIGALEALRDAEALAAGVRYESEPNDTYSTAAETYDDYDNYGTISSSTSTSSDVDWWKIKFPSAGKANFWLGNIPGGCDYEIKLYSSNGTTLIARSSTGGNAEELISEYNVSANTYYYIAVYSYEGYNTSTQYLLRAKNYPAGVSDGFEPNNSISAATVLPSSEYYYLGASVHNATDEDYYKFTLSTRSQSSMYLSGIPDGCDYDLKLKDSSGNVLASSSNGSNNMEEIIAPLDAGTYYAQVYSYSGYSSVDYWFQIQSLPLGDGDVFEVNNTSATASSIGAASTINTANIHNSSDVDYYTFRLGSAKNVNIALSNIPSGCDYDLHLYNSSNTLLSSSTSSGNNMEYITATLLSGIYYIKVSSYAGYSSSHYLLETTNAAPDDYGNDFAAAHNMGTINGTSATTLSGSIELAGDVDMFKFTAPKSETFDIETTGSTDTYGYLYNSSQSQLAENDDGGDGNNFKVSYNLTSGQTYYIKVRNYSTSNTGSYTLKITPSSSSPTAPNNTSLLSWPTSSTDMTLGFGPIKDGSNVVHTGMDFQGMVGDEIYSAADGVVSYVGTNPYYGNVVYINSRYNGNNIQIRYAHLKANSISVSVGQTVSRGDVIAQMGATGNQVSLNNPTKNGILEIELLTSTNGAFCDIDGSNTTKVDPLDYFKPLVTDGYYLTEAFNVSLNNTGVNTAALTEQEEKDMKNIVPYGLNGYVHIRKVMAECQRERGKKDEKKKDIPMWSSDFTNGVFTLSMIYPNKKDGWWGVGSNNAYINSDGEMWVGYDAFIEHYFQYTRPDYYGLDLGVQSLLGGKYRDGQEGEYKNFGGMSQAYARADVAGRASISNQSTMLKNYNLETFNRIMYLNNPQGAGGFGHNAVLLLNTQNQGIFFSFWNGDGGYDDGEMRVAILDEDHYKALLYGNNERPDLPIGEVHNISTHDGQVVKEVASDKDRDYEMSIYNGIIGKTIDGKYVSASTLGKSAFYKGVEVFRNPGQWEMFGQQCDVVAQRIMRAAGHGYIPEIAPDESFKLHSYNTGIPAHDNRDGKYYHVIRFPNSAGPDIYVWFPNS